ncbi:MAG: hypothetical protein JNK89_06835, partial [Saprospiraceae bacterium]|nr:hypothetical protein [Saprospiraceae bacterium]
MFSQLKNRFVCAMALATGLLLVGCKEDPLSLPIFHEISSPTPYDLTAVWFADSLCGYLTAGAAWTRGELWSTIDGGVHWQLDTAVGSRLEGVVFDADGNGYACGQDGLLLLRYAGTAHWYPVRYDYVWHRSCAFRNLGQGLIVSGEGFQGGGIRKLGPDAPWSLDTTLLFPNALSSLCYSDSQTVHAVG